MYTTEMNVVNAISQDNDILLTTTNFVKSTYPKCHYVYFYIRVNNLMILSRNLSSGCV